MTQEEIKNKADEQYKIIGTASAILSDLRQLCKHPNVEEKLYSARVGQFHYADMCSDCGQVVKVLQDKKVEF